MANEYVDLFGNSTLTPREVIQQQIAKSMENTQILYKDANPINRASAIWGTGLGSLFRSVLQEKGIIEKDPEVLRAEESESFRAEVDKRVSESGADITKNPEVMGDFAVKILMEKNEDGSPKYKYLSDLLPRAIQYTQAVQASRRAGELEAAKLETERGKPELQKAQTEEAIAKKNKAEAEAGRVPSEIAETKARTEKIKRETEKISEEIIGLRSAPKDVDNSVYNTALRAFDRSYNFTETYGLQDKSQTPAYTHGLKLLKKHLARTGDPGMAASLAFEESQKQHILIKSVIKKLRADGMNDKQIKEELTKSELGKDVQPDIYFEFKK